MSQAKEEIASQSKCESAIVLDSAKTLETVLAVTETIRSRTKYRPTIGIVCGSGLGKISSLVKDAEVYPYSSLAGFPRSTVHGHHGNLLIGRLDLDLPPKRNDDQEEELANDQVIVMQGRCHSYEGYSHWHASLPIRVMQQLGVRILVLTSAVGSLRDTIAPGDIVVLRDHLNLPAFCGRNPLFGMRDARLGPRVLPVDNMYDRVIRKLTLQTASELQSSSSSIADKLRVHVGVLGVGTGPMYEGVAEARLFRQLGLDVMGMSIAHESIQARHCGMKVLAFAVVSNAIATNYDVNAFHSDGSSGDAEHQGVVATCVRASEQLTPLLLGTLRKVVRQPDLFRLTTYEDGWWKD